MSKTGQEYREDGWPLCPQCESDELWSQVGGEAPDWEAPLLEAYFDEPFRCYYCNWEGRLAMKEKAST